MIIMRETVGQKPPSRNISSLNHRLSIFVTLLTIFILTEPSNSSKIKATTPPLASLNLADTPDKLIHEYCVLNQIDNYRPALKSLETRETISLDGQYDFCFDEQRQGFSLNWPSRSLRSVCPPDSLYQMPVPSAFNSIPSNGSAHNYIGWSWYQRTFSLVHRSPEQVDNEQYWLQFESVNYLALVWLQPLEVANEAAASLVGSHVGGHLPFAINISQLVRPPKELTATPRALNLRLTIAVSNKLDENTIPSGKMIDLSQDVGRHYERFVPDFDFFHYAGILGPIRLIKLPPIHLASVERVFKQHEHFYHHMVWLEICLAGNLTLADSGKLRAKLSQFGETSSIVEKTTNILYADQCYKTFLDLFGAEHHQVANWTLANGNPNHLSALYSIRLELIGADARPIDVYELRVAFRAGQALLLGRQFQGFGLHQEQLFSGRTMSLAAVMKDVYLLKQMGTNLVRTSHYPYSSEFLDACDQHGLLVVAECPAVGLEKFGELKLELHKQILREMMHRDNHHPSIMMWSIANEPQSQLRPAREYFAKLVEFARTELARYTLDAGRPLTAAIAQSDTDDLVGDLLDVVMVNRYMGWYEATGVVGAVRRPLLARLCGWAKRLPGKPLLVSEFGAEALAGLHRWSAAPEVDIYSEEFQQELLLEHERLFDELWQESASGDHNATAFNCSERINFIGSMVWNFADFSTSTSLTRIGGLNRKGIFTRDREPKMAAKAIRQVYLRRLTAANAGGHQEVAPRV